MIVEVFMYISEQRADDSQDESLGVTDDPDLHKHLHYVQGIGPDALASYLIKLQSRLERSMRQSKDESLETEVDDTQILT